MIKMMDSSLWLCKNSSNIMIVFLFVWLDPLIRYRLMSLYQLNMVRLSIIHSNCRLSKLLTLDCTKLWKIKCNRTILIMIIHQWCSRYSVSQVKTLWKCQMECLVVTSAITVSAMMTRYSLSSRKEITLSK
jgi:hypothetical protein